MIVLQNTHTVEYCGSIPEHIPDNFFVDARGEIVLQGDGSFVDFFESAIVGYREHFDIECETFDQQARHDGIENFFAKYFHAGLSVTDLEPEKQFDENLVTEAIDAAKWRIGNLGSWMPFGADDNIGVVPFHVFKKHREAIGVEIAPSVDKGDILPCCLLHAKSDGVTFALIFFITRNFDFGFLECVLSESFGFFPGPIEFAIHNDDHLVIIAEVLKDMLDVCQIFADSAGLFICRYDDG